MQQNLPKRRRATPHKDCATDASSNFSSDETKSGVNTCCIHEHFCEIWREICKQMACKVARRSLCGIAVDRRLWTRALIPQSPYCGPACKPQKAGRTPMQKYRIFKQLPHPQETQVLLYHIFRGLCRGFQKFFRISWNLVRNAWNGGAWRREFRCLRTAT